jgi:chromosome partitioning protein
MWQQAIASGNTINKIFQSFCNRNVAIPGSEIIITDPFKKRNKDHDIYPNIDLVSAQFELDDTEIDLASTFIGNPTVSDWDKRVLIASWLDRILAYETYDYIIFDCPPATKIVSQNALAASDGYIVPVIPDEISSRGVTHFQALVSNKIDGKLKYLKNAAQIATPPVCFEEDTDMVAIVPSLIKSAGAAASGMVNIHTEQLNALNQAWGADVLPHVGRNYVSVPVAMTAGWPVWNYGSDQKAEQMMTDICAALKTRIDAL